MNKSSAFCILLLVSGCGPTTAQTQMTQIRGEMDQIGFGYTSCRATVLSDPQYGEFARRIPLAGPPSQTAMADRTTIRPRDRAAAAAFFDVLATCREHIAAHLPAVLQPTLPVYQQAWAMSDNLAARLIGGQISWGAYLADDAAIQSEFRSQIAAAQQAAVQPLAMEHAREMQGRAIAGAVLGVALGAAAGAAAGAAVAPRPYVYSPTYVVRRYR